MNAVALPTPRPAWRMAQVLGIAATLSAACVMPYALELVPAAQREQLPPLAVLVPLQLVQALVLYTFMAWAGLRLGERVGLDAPLLRAWLHGGAATTGARWWRDTAIGAVLALGAVALVVSLLDPRLPPPRGGELPTPSALQGFLASFYGGIGEELQLRLFFATLVAWLLARAGLARRNALAIAIVVAAVVFGLAHLPAAAGVWPIDGVVVTRTIVANALPGIVFGVLYARHGLEAAIVAHFVTDIGLHVVPPLLAG